MLTPEVNEVLGDKASYAEATLEVVCIYKSLKEGDPTYISFREYVEQITSGEELLDARVALYDALEKASKETSGLSHYAGKLEEQKNVLKEMRRTHHKQAIKGHYNQDNKTIDETRTSSNQARKSVHFTITSIVGNIPEERKTPVRKEINDYLIAFTNTFAEPG